MPTLNENIHQAIDDFDNIKSAIIEKGVDVPTGTSTREYDEKIREIETGITPSGTIGISENGEYDVTKYAVADINVPQPSGKINITENGTDIDVARYAKANVNVSGLTVDTVTSGDTVSVCEPVPNQLYDLQILEDDEIHRIGLDCCFANKNVRTVTIGDNITIIEDGLGQDAYSLSNVVWYSSFGYCDNLTYVYGGTRITKIGRLAFACCRYLVDLPDMLSSGNVETIGDNAFYYCRSLYCTVKFNHLREIGHSAFRGGALKQLYVIGTATLSGENAIISNNAFDGGLAGKRIEKIILNTSGGSTLEIHNSAFETDSGTTTDVFAILSDDIVFSITAFAHYRSSITNFYTHLNQSDFTTWLNNLNDTALKNAITNATNIHYEYAGDGSEL